MYRITFLFHFNHTTGKDVDFFSTYLPVALKIAAIDPTKERK